jgi:hypothetical protein
MRSTHSKKESIEIYLNNLLPGIFMRWSVWCPKKAGIQLNDVPTHPIPGRLGAKIDACLAEMNTGGWDIGFQWQPAYSPDFNTLDQTFFCTIQSLQYQKCAKNINNLIVHFQEAFASFISMFVKRFGQLPKLS